MYPDEQDKAFIEAIKERYHLTTDVAAVRLAMKRVATETQDKGKKG